ncbi:MAG: hypothetical protein ABSG42_01120 [Nitrospirota bacterium]
MKKIIILSALLVFMVFAGCSNERVTKPELKGKGPLALKLPAGVLSPEYHQPVDYWKQHHMDILKRGDYSKHECMLCHDVNTSCNNCHDYVGVVKVEGYE